jgi:hypothetical protein
MSNQKMIWIRFCLSNNVTACVCDNIILADAYQLNETDALYEN